MSSRLKISLALLVGFVGLAIAGANLPVDTQLTIRTKLGKRTQPHWLVPADSKIVRTEGGSGLFRLAGGLLGCMGFATAMHLAGSDERQQRLFWARQGAIDGIQQRENEVSTEIGAGVRLKKLQMDAQAEVDLYSLRVQEKFREAIGFTPIVSVDQPALPHGKPGTLGEIIDPGDKIETPQFNHLTSSDSLTQALLESDIAPIVFAGFLKLIGTPGSGKTTLTSALIRCRIKRGHKMIIVNAHKRKSMYRGIEKYLFPNTQIYAVGLGDEQRAKSLKAGLDKILDILGDRYDEYQNNDEGTYSHSPVTFLLEEVGEWQPLLSLIMSNAETVRYLQVFWQKLFIAARKAKTFPLVTAQIDTQAMFKAQGLSELIKQSGAVTLLMTAVPDSNSEDGWRPSGMAKLRLPNQKSVDVVVLDCRTLIADVDYFGDCFSATGVAASPVEPVVETPPVTTSSSPPQRTTLHQLESMLHQDCTNLHPIPELWEFPDPTKPLTPEVRAVVVGCKRSGMSQTAAISAIWGLNKSGSDKRYEAARNHYQSVFV